MLPDILRAFTNGETVVLRHPGATRPWQHVLEPLAGYLLLAQSLYEHGQDYADGWNFGPFEPDAIPVLKLVETMAFAWGDSARWSVDRDASHPHEAQHLKLDISKAQARLGWKPRWDIATALARTVEWHCEWLTGADMNACCRRQIEEYTAALS